MGSKNTNVSQRGRDVAESKHNDELKKHFIEDAIEFYQVHGQKDYATSLPIFLREIVLPPKYSKVEYDEYFPGVYETIKKIYETAEEYSNSNETYTSISIDNIPRNRFLRDDDIRNILKRALAEKQIPFTKSARKTNYKKMTQK